MRPVINRRLLLLPIQILFLAACAGAAADRGPLTGSSKTLTVRGEYSAVALDEIAGMALQDGKLALRNSEKKIALVDLPAMADATTPGRGWSLVTEATANDRRTVTFTHETTLDDFTLELPASDAPLRYGSLGGKSGDDVLVFAWGENSKSFWGWVAIERNKK
jgi:hypothetical protein